MNTEQQETKATAGVSELSDMLGGRDLLQVVAMAAGHYAAVCADKRSGGEERL